MTITPFSFTPPNGLRDASYAPTDPPNEAALRQALQGIPDQLKDYINNTLLTSLASTTALISGAREIGSETLPGIVGNTVYAQLLALLNYINSISIGNVPINSITNDKLATDVKVGSLAALNTADKTSVVNAINETNTASNMLDKIKTVDGSGSGLDADLFGGYNSNEFLKTGAGTIILQNNGDLCVDPSKTYYVPSDGINLPNNQNEWFVTVQLYSNNSMHQIWRSFNVGNAEEWHREYVGGSSWRPFRQVIMDNPTVTTITTGFASGWSGTISATKNHNNLLDFGIDLTKNVDISTTETIYTLAVGLRPTKTINILINLATSSYGTVSNSFAILQIATTGTVGIIPVSSTNLVNARKIAFTQCMYYTA